MKHDCSHWWNSCETDWVSMKYNRSYWWNSGETVVKQWWNSGETDWFSMKHDRSYLWKSGETDWIDMKHDRSNWWNSGKQWWISGETVVKVVKQTKSAWNRMNERDEQRWKTFNQDESAMKQFLSRSGNTVKHVTNNVCHKAQVCLNDIPGPIIAGRIQNLLILEYLVGLLLRNTTLHSSLTPLLTDSVSLAWS